jgi:hypothetical protein
MMGRFSGIPWTVILATGIWMGTNIKERSNLKIPKSNPILQISLSFFFILFAGISGSYGQPESSFSASYDFFPFSKLTDPGPGTFEQDLEVRVATFYAEFVTPSVYSEGRMVLVN